MSADNGRYPNLRVEAQAEEEASLEEFCIAGFDLAPHMFQPQAAAAERPDQVVAMLAARISGLAKSMAYG